MLKMSSTHCTAMFSSTYSVDRAGSNPNIIWNIIKILMGYSENVCNLHAKNVIYTLHGNVFLNLVCGQGWIYSERYLEHHTNIDVIFGELVQLTC
jgi:hypothetical protein